MHFKQKVKFLPIYLFSKLPLRFLFLLSDLGFIIVYYILNYRRNTVRENLIRSFPNMTEKEIKKLEKKFYRHFCNVFIEILKSTTISEKEVRKRINVTNPELITKYFDTGKSIIFYTSHQGNWEWLSLLPLFVPHQVTALYTPPSNGYFDEYMKMIRSRFGMICIEANKGYRTILKLNKNNVLTLNLIAGDQCPTQNSTKHWVRFLNQETCFSVGADRIAKKSNQVIIFPSYRKIKRGYYEIDLKLIHENPSIVSDNSIIDSYAELLEKAIIDSPEMWLWSHKRWKIKRQ